MQRQAINRRQKQGDQEIDLLVELMATVVEREREQVETQESKWQEKKRYYSSI